MMKDIIAEPKLIMDKNRLEAFSDGVMAIIITIMVLELKVPHDPTWNSYLEAWPIFISYALSFVFVGLYWVSHHYLFQLAHKVNNKVLWINMLGLFWLSLIPFCTGAMGENSFKDITVTIYAVILTFCVTSYIFLVYQLRLLNAVDSDFAKAFHSNFKSYLTVLLNLTAALIAFLGWPKLAFLLLGTTSLVWFIPNHPFSNLRSRRKTDGTPLSNEN